MLTFVVTGMSVEGYTWKSIGRIGYTFLYTRTNDYNTQTKAVTTNADSYHSGWILTNNGMLTVYPKPPKLYGCSKPVGPCYIYKWGAYDYWPHFSSRSINDDFK